MVTPEVPFAQLAFFGLVVKQKGYLSTHTGAYVHSYTHTDVL